MNPYNHHKPKAAQTSGQTRHDAPAPLVRLAACALVLSFACASYAQQQDWIQSWAFNGRTETSVRQGLQNQAEQKLTQLKEHCNLTDEQHAKLKLAANGDISRFFSEVAKVRKATAKVDQQNQNDVQEAWNLVRPLTERMQAGIYGENSLFAKVMSSTLEESQIEKYQKIVRDQLERRHHALVLSMVTTLEKNVPMVGDQREKLVALLDAQPVTTAKQKELEAFVGYVKLSRVPDEELEKLFDKDQLKVIMALRERYIAITQMFN